MSLNTRHITTRMITKIELIPHTHMLLFHDARGRPMFMVRKDAIFDTEGVAIEYAAPTPGKVWKDAGRD